MATKLVTKETRGVGNVMTPLNYGSVIFEAFMGLMGTFASDPIIRYGSFAVCVCFAIFYCYVYHYFMKKDPNRLQSEPYNLEREAMALGRLDVLPVIPGERDAQRIQDQLGIETMPARAETTDIITVQKED